MTSRGARLTFGMEWEFLLDPTTGPLGDPRHPQSVEPEPKWTPRYSTVLSARHPAFRHVSVFLRQHGFKAICSMEYDQILVDQEFAAQFPDISQSSGPLTERLRQQDFHMVKTDGSLIDYDRARSMTLGDEFVKVEITTPVLQFQSQDSYNEVERAFSLIAQNFKIKVNPSCGLHVVSSHLPHPLAQSYQMSIHATNLRLLPSISAMATMDSGSNGRGISQGFAGPLPPSSTSSTLYIAAPGLIHSPAYVTTRAWPTTSPHSISKARTLENYSRPTRLITWATPI